MALTPAGLSALVVIDHLTLFPTAVAAVRSNPATGVIPHNPSFAFIDALCDAVVVALKTLPIHDIGSGTADVLGTAIPVPFTFPGIPAAQAQLIATSGWVGPQSALAAQIFVGSVLLNVSKLGLLVMPTNPLLGTGTGVVSLAANPGLEVAANAALMAALPVSFQATGKFGAGDVPGAPVNPTLLRQLPLYAAALAKGISTLSTAVPYVGTATPSPPVTGIVNTGVLL